MSSLYTRIVKVRSNMHVDVDKCMSSTLNVAVDKCMSPALKFYPVFRHIRCHINVKRKTYVRT